MKVIPNKRAYQRPVPTSRSLDFRRRRSKPDIRKIRKILIAILEIAAVIIAGYLVIRAFATQVIMTEESMEPQIQSQDKLLIDRVRYRISDPKQGDVIAFSTPGDLSGRYSVKRIIATPGQKVVIKSGAIYVNDKVYTVPVETSTIQDAGLAASEITLGKNEYFVLGDNRDVSEDSRYTTVGNIMKSEIKGKIWFDVTPASFGVVD